MVQGPRAQVKKRLRLERGAGGEGGAAAPPSEKRAGVQGARAQVKK